MGFCPRHRDAGDQRYLGQWGSDEAAQCYRRFQIEWADGLASVQDAGRGLTVNALCVAYLIHAESYYRKDGRATGEVAVIRAAIAEFRQVCGSAIEDVDERDAEAMRRRMIDAGRARRTINHYMARVRGMLSWGASKRGAGRRPLVPAEVVLAVRGVGQLRAGRSNARETAPRSAVRWADVERTLPHLAPRVPARGRVLADAVRVQWLLGCRPGEICAMRIGDIDRTRPEWRYAVPGGGKNAHRGLAGVYWIGPRAQAILAPYMHGGPGRQVFALPRGDGQPIRLTTARYRRAIALACRAAMVPHWIPHQIRHARATEIGRVYESDAAAAAAIGDTEDVTREIYRGQPGEAAKRRIARELG